LKIRLNFAIKIKTEFMKKIALLLSGIVVGFAANAQLTLSGTSYTQDFDNIETGLPTGWALFTYASSDSLGTDVSATKYVSAPTRWNWTTGNFRNVASADGLNASSDTTAQNASTDRALAVRQVGYTSGAFPGTDSGAAFALQIANTTGFSDFQLSFKLQSLDSTSPRKTTWTVDYGFGAAPTSFTSVTVTGNNTTGDTSFTNETITVNFGNALDNHNGPVWIRIAALNQSTGGGNRPTTGIDDFELNWNIINSVKNVNAERFDFGVLGNATSERIRVGFTTEGGKFDLNIHDLTGRKVYNEKVSLQAGTKEYTINHLNLLPGVYVISMSNGKAMGVAKAVIQ